MPKSTRSALGDRNREKTIQLSGSKTSLGRILGLALENFRYRRAMELPAVMKNSASLRKCSRGAGHFHPGSPGATLRRALHVFEMGFCDLIMNMEKAEVGPRPAVGAIVVVSALAVSFLLWLLYVHHASADFAGRWTFLPALNALLNGLCAIALCVGLYFIKHHNREAHRASMLVALTLSSIFLVSYIVNHAMHGDTIFPGHSPVRTLYLSILASHVILSIVALPMVITTFFFSLTGRFAMHRRIARWTFPIWLYVSITGVVVFVFLKAYAY